VGDQKAIIKPQATGLLVDCESVLEERRKIEKYKKKIEMIKES
jgi:hypothetical protein